MTGVLSRDCCLETFSKMRVRPGCGASFAGVGVVVDPGGKKNGRGAYVCRTIECVEKALDSKRKPLERALKTPIPPNLIDALRAAIAGD